MTVPRRENSVSKISVMFSQSLGNPNPSKSQGVQYINFHGFSQSHYTTCAILEPHFKTHLPEDKRSKHAVTGEWVDENRKAPVESSGARAKKDD